jgi:hypothetical protein
MYLGFEFYFTISDLPISKKFEFFSNSIMTILSHLVIFSQ